MKCLDPILCYRSPDGNKYRHFSLANRLFKSLADKIFPCRTCTLCRKRLATELATRCVLHASLYKDNCFLTLTYDEAQDGYINELDYTHIQNFKKRLRRYVQYYHNKRIQIFNVHEYGKNGKKHWHLVVFNFDFPNKEIQTTSKGNKLYTSPLLSKLWTYGFHTIGDVTEASAMYQAQYTQKDLINGNFNNAKKSKSKHSGIGRDFFLQHYKQILSLGYIPFNGKKVPIFRYFQRLAHKHYSHFYAPENFQNYSHRKALYRPFKKSKPNKEIADLYQKFSDEKQIKITELESEMELIIQEHLDSGLLPDMILSAQNHVHDLKNRNSKGEF